MSRFHRYSGPGDPSTRGCFAPKRVPRETSQIPGHPVGDLHLPGVSPFTNATPLAIPLLYSYIQPLTSQTHLYTLNVHSTPPLMYQMPLQDLISTYQDIHVQKFSTLASN